MTPQDFQRRIGLAAQAFQSGKYTDAAQAAKQLLLAVPDQPDALHLLGLSEFKAGRSSYAFEPLRKAATAGNLSHVRSYAIVLRENDRREDAIAAVEIAGGGRGPMAGLLGILYLEIENYEKAAAALGSAVAQNPEDVEAQINLGIVQERLGRTAQAASSFSEALALNPAHAGVRISLARVLLAQGNILEAKATLGPIANDAAPDIQALNGAIALEEFNYASARPFLTKAISADPSNLAATVNLALTEIGDGNWESARNILAAAAEAHPEFKEAHLHLAQVERDLGNLGAARDAIEALLNHNTGDADARFELAHIALMQGDLAVGFAAYEARWDLTARKVGRLPSKPSLGLRQWDGQSSGKLLLLSEQGFGDTVMFARFVAEASKRLEHITVFCQQELVTLLGESLDGLADVVGLAPEAGVFDFEITIMSLPYVLGMAEDEIASTRLQLRVPDRNQSKWAERLNALSGIKVGVVWSGNPDFVRQGRWLTFDQLAPLMAVGGIDWVSLQMGPARDEISGAPERFYDWTDEIEDFSDTAAITAGLDLVITADTALSHVAGGLGLPFWLLNRFQSEWRWQRGRTDSPWYPTARLFNQPQRGDWASVVDDAARALSELVKG